MAQKYRSFFFTFNNYSFEDFQNLQANLQADGVTYYIIGEEVGEKKCTPHLQGCIVYKNPRSWDAVKKRFDQRIHWQKTESLPDAIKYCEKEGKWVEWGERPKGKGKRTDLDDIKVSIMEGKRVDDIVLESPMLYHQYGRTLNKIQDLAMRKKYRTKMTEGVWYWGETGVGKSHRAFEGFTPETHYVWSRDNGWWDAYVQQPIVIINEFRGDIPYGQLLDLLDKWPTTVRRRNGEPIPFVSERVIITSSLPPEDIYHNLAAKDSLAQLLRRCTVVCLSRNGTEVVGGNTSPPPDTQSVLDIMSATPVVDPPTFEGILKDYKKLGMGPSPPALKR